MEKSKESSESSERIDRLLVKRGLAPTRNKAQELIQNGCVEITENGQNRLVTRASERISMAAEIHVNDSEGVLRYVSRAGLKLEAAINHLGLSLKGIRALDVGQSTGGFTDVLLREGVQEIVGIEVGHGQLHPRLQPEKRVTTLEGLNIKNWRNSEDFFSRKLDGFDLIVVDVSFISLSEVIPHLADLLSPGGDLLMLVKPQFEVGAKNLDKKGLVKDSLLYPEVLARLESELRRSGLKLEDKFESAIRGKDGNLEFFIYAKQETE